MIDVLASRLEGRELPAPFRLRRAAQRPTDLNPAALRRDFNVRVLDHFSARGKPYASTTIFIHFGVFWKVRWSLTETFLPLVSLATSPSA